MNIIQRGSGESIDRYAFTLIINYNTLMHELRLIKRMCIYEYEVRFLLIQSCVCATVLLIQIHNDHKIKNRFTSNGTKIQRYIFVE